MDAESVVPFWPWSSLEPWLIYIDRANLVPRYEGIMTAGKKDEVKTNLRIDEQLHQRLAEAAGRSVRSINGEIIYRLRRSFDREAAEQAA